MWDPLPKLNQGEGGGGERKIKSLIWDPPIVLNDGPPLQIKLGGGGRGKKSHPIWDPSAKRDQDPPPHKVKFGGGPLKSSPTRPRPHQPQGGVATPNPAPPFIPPSERTPIYGNPSNHALSPFPLARAAVTSARKRARREGAGRLP